jgi:hypothetical protein
VADVWRIHFPNFAKKQFNREDNGAPKVPSASALLIPASAPKKEEPPSKTREAEPAAPADPPPASPQKPPRIHAKTPPPENLEGDDWRRLVSRLWHTMPHLVAKDESPPAPHCSLGWVRSESAACLDHFRGKGERRADWPATCSTWIHKSDEDKWRWLKRAPPLRGEYHADEGTFLPDVLRKPNGSESPVDRDERGSGAADAVTPAEHIARAGAKPALRLADSRA